MGRWRGGVSLFSKGSDTNVHVCLYIYDRLGLNCVAVVCNVLRIQLAASTTDVALFFSFVMGARL